LGFLFTASLLLSVLGTIFSLASAFVEYGKKQIVWTLVAYAFFAYTLFGFYIID